ncbi:MAG: thiamine pyrophosphate-binding protein [Thermoanaerobaculia bacterium]|nr:thiamine pyrophosphate-binding protein [Thermoanaerobaculia bacterium]
MTANGGALIAEVLVRHGVKFLFTLCGGHISPILVEAKRRGIRVIDTRHEATAVFAADAVARLTGVPGVAAVTAGPGVTNTLTALQNARMAESPLVLLGGATPTLLKGRGALQDIDQRAIVEPLVKKFFAVDRVRNLARAVEEAFRVARDGVPGPVFVECPVDVLYPRELVAEWYGGKPGGEGKGKKKELGKKVVEAFLRFHAWRLFAGAGRVQVGRPAAVEVPAPGGWALWRVARWVRKAQRPVLVLGSGALAEAGQAQELAAAVEALGVPVFLGGMARGLLGREHPLQLRHCRTEALKRADLVILAGFPIDFRLDYGRKIGAGAKLVTVGRDLTGLIQNRRPKLHEVADAGRFLVALAKRGARSARSAWLAELREKDAAREAKIDQQAAEVGELLNPVALCRQIEAALPEAGLLVADGGDFVATAAYTVRPRGPLTWLDPGAFGTLGVGAGFALGAKLVRPESEVWLLWGDGSSGYGLAEFDTFARHGLPILAVVGNDASWMQIARDQVEILGDAVGTELARTDYHTVAEGFGGRGFVVSAQADVPGVLAAARAALAEGKPVLINAHLGRSDFRKGSISM